MQLLFVYLTFRRTGYTEFSKTDLQSAYLHKWNYHLKHVQMCVPVPVCFSKVLLKTEVFKAHQWQPCVFNVCAVLPVWPIGT